MNESQYAKEFMNEVRAIFGKDPSLVVFRHVEQFQAGVPDYSMSMDGKTLWIEFKLVDKEGDKARYSPAQEDVLERLINSIVVTFYRDNMPSKKARIAFYRDQISRKVISFFCN